jgi:hypothetical protein
MTAYWIYSKHVPVMTKPIEYSPLIHKPDIHFWDLSGTKIREPTYSVQYAVPDNADKNARHLDDFLQLPLETDGSMYDTSFIERMDTNTPFIKYVRFQFKEVRNSEKLEVGGFRFLLKSAPIPFERIQQWNPHTGQASAYTGGSWGDSDQHTIVFCFDEPLQFDMYEIKTSGLSSDHDPIRWIVEGSMNAGYWNMLDDRGREDMMIPLERRKVMKFRLSSPNSEAQTKLLA